MNTRWRYFNGFRLFHGICGTVDFEDTGLACYANGIAANWENAKRNYPYLYKHSKVATGFIQLYQILLWPVAKVSPNHTDSAKLFFLFF
jgi:hypothetical protein